MNFLSSIFPAQSSSFSSGGDMTGTLAMAGFNISESCQSAFSGLITPELSACLDLPGLLPLIQANESIIPPLDDYLTSLCSTPACSDQTLTNLASSITEGCSAEFQMFNISETVVYDAISVYPVARDLVCLKTTAPESVQFDNASIPIDTFASDNGTFCLTDVTTQLSAYWGGDLSWGNLFFSGLAEAYNRRLPEGILCQDCVYGMVAIVNEAYPNATQVEFELEDQTISVDEYLEGLCGSEGYDGTAADGVLPESIVPGATNETAGDAAESEAIDATKRTVWIAKDVERL